eukprot:5625949-Pyramimonas_sp.AAC.1
MWLFIYFIYSTYAHRSSRAGGAARRRRDTFVLVPPLLRGGGREDVRIGRALSSAAAPGH